MQTGARIPASLVMILGNFGVVCGAFAIVGVLPAVRSDLGMSALQAGMLVSVYALTYAAASPFLGWMATRFRYREVMVVATLTASAGAFTFAMSDSTAVLMASRVAAAVGAALFTPTAAALAIARSEPGREGQALSLVSFGIPMSQVVGLPLAAWIGNAYGWRTAFASLGVFLILVAILCAVSIPTARRPGTITLRAFASTMMDGTVLRNVALTFMFSLTTNTIFTFQAQIFGDRGGLSPTEIGVALFFLGIGTLTGTWLTGRSIDKLGPARTLAWQGTATIAVCLPMTLAGYGLAGASLLGVVAGIAMYNHIPAMQVRLMKLMPDSAGMLFAVNAAFVYLGAAAGGSLSGAVLDGAGIGALGPVAAGCGVATLAYLAWLARRKPERDQ